MNSEASTHSVKNILCVLSPEQAQDFEPDLKQLRGPNIELLMASSAEEALLRLGDINPRLVIAGMDLGEMEGLEFLALLMHRYPNFNNKVVVLPDRTDPFPPVLQYRDRATGRSVTEQTDWNSVVGLARALAMAPSTIPPPGAMRSVPPVRPVANVAVDTIDEWARALDASLHPPTPASEAALVRFPPASPVPRLEVVASERAPVRLPPPSPAPPEPEVVASELPPIERTPDVDAYAPARSTEPRALRKRVPLIATVAVVVVALVLLARLLFGGSAEPAEQADQAKVGAGARTERPAAKAVNAPAGAAAVQNAVLPKAARPPSPQPEPRPEPRLQAPAMPSLDKGITLPLRFDRGRAAFGVSDAAELERLLGAFAAALEANPRARIELGGHTSEEGTDTKNQLLGQRRASEAQRHLVEHGLPAERVTLKSYGETAPHMGEGAASSRSGLRRVTLKLLR